MSAVGQILNARYALTRQLGEGGMARVYLADDQTLGRQVAIKMLHGDLNQNAEVSARFLREARIFASLKHPHIVDIYDVLDLGEGRVAMVMEYIDGTDLAGVLDRGMVLVPELAVLLLRPIADALSYAHGRGVVHRDVKPANVLLGRDGAIKLSDFGIAKAAEQTQVTRTGDFLGTPAYIAPEQARGEEISPASDQFALGVMLYEMVTGRRPFDASTPVAILSKVLIGHYEDPRKLSKAVDERLAEVIHTALADKPSKRFESLSALLDAMRPEQPLDAERVRSVVTGLVEQPQQTARAVAREIAQTYVGIGRAALQTNPGRAREAALKALARDPEVAEAHDLLAKTPVPGEVEPKLAPKTLAFAETAEARRADYNIPTTTGPTTRPPVDGRADTDDVSEAAHAAVHSARFKQIEAPRRNGRWVVVIAILIAAAIGGGITWMLRTLPAGSKAAVVAQPGTLPARPDTPASAESAAPKTAAPATKAAPDTTTAAPATQAAAPTTQAAAPATRAAPSTRSAAPPSRAARPAVRRPASPRSAKRAPASKAKAPATTAVVAKGPPGKLVVRVVPWGDLRVDGALTSKGKLNHPALTLPSGTHTVDVRHPKWGKKTRTVRVEAGKTTTVKISLK
jgi:tRNA A-37 threonylcarbamoyl transferase component Bud32/cytoskeletal protein RodZ